MTSLSLPKARAERSGGDVEQAIQPAELLDGEPNEFLVRSFISDVESFGHGVGGWGFDLINDGLRSRLVEISRNYFRTFLRKPDSRSASYIPRRRSSNNGHLTLESSHCSLSC